jgi:aerobic carbon-monoxide dehydrogenase small subunit
MNVSKMDVRLLVNGEENLVAIEPNWTLLKVLREQLGLTGSKEGCATGACGACTVLVDGEPIYACLSLAVTLEGRDLLTIEGVCDGGALHPIQAAFAELGASQCGFSTPGLIMAAKALLGRNPSPTDEELRDGLSGNFCRCTGYVKVFEAVKAAAAIMREA